MKSGMESDLPWPSQLERIEKEKVCSSIKESNVKVWMGSGFFLGIFLKAARKGQE